MEIAVFLVVVIAYSLFAKRFYRVGVTAPMVLLAVGLLVFGTFGTSVLSNSAIHVLAELALVIVLFHDASTVKLPELFRDRRLALRLLAVGFPLALAMTCATVGWLLPGLGFAGALLIAGAITPTDAGLGAPTILNPKVPPRISRALNVESGLNDGLATPVVLFALSALSAETAPQRGMVFEIAIEPLALAIALAVVAALVGAALVDRSARLATSSTHERAIAVLLLPLLIFGISHVLDANAFIGAFVGGLVFGSSTIAYAREHALGELLETGASLVGYAVWYLAGGLLVLVFQEGYEWQWVVIALLALTVLRLVPVAISLIGSGLRWPSVLFLGWFGPRGLATIVFGLLAVEELGTTSEAIRDVAGVLATTVVLSVFAHGASAGVGAARYGSWVTREKPAAETALG